MPTCLLNVAKILVTGAPVAMSSRALIRIRWERFNWVSGDSHQVLLSMCYKMGKSRATDPSSLAHSLFNTIQLLPLSFTSFSRQTHPILQGCLHTCSLSFSSLSLSPFYEPSSDFTMALAPALSAIHPALLLMPGDLVVVNFLSAAMGCTGPLTAIWLFLAFSELHGSCRALHGP